VSKIRIAVIGAGQFGRNHIRLLRRNPRVELTGIVDTNAERAAAAAAEFELPVWEDLEAVDGNVDAAVVAVPTVSHEAVGCALLGKGIHVLVEKPIAASLEAARRLTEAARLAGCVLQVGHVERFNPAVAAVKPIVKLPLFFEVHRLNLFTPRSLDVDVVLDLMIHDIDIVLWLCGQMPEEIRAAGISVLSRKVDIASVRLAFPGGCVANLTASRVSTERVRKLRVFQPFEYISLDYSRQDAFRLSVSEGQKIGGGPLPIEKDEPLHRELEAFLDAVEHGTAPAVDGAAACRTLEVALSILAKIEEHAEIVSRTLQSAR
jgi:predicted dehydrogenase